MCTRLKSVDSKKIDNKKAVHGSRRKKKGGVKILKIIYCENLNVSYQSKEEASRKEE